MTERDEWASLVTHPGYLRLLEVARLEWVVGYPAKIKRAIADARAANQDIGAAVAEIDSANNAINALLSWPDARIAQLDAQKERESRPASLSRGGR
jgi:hypothetical protein